MTAALLGGKLTTGSEWEVVAEMVDGVAPSEAIQKWLFFHAKATHHMLTEESGQALSSNWYHFPNQSLVF